MRDLTVDDYLNIIDDDRFEITEIRAEDEQSITSEELKDVIKQLSRIESHAIYNEVGKYCISGMVNGELIAFDVKNKTNDTLFLDSYFDGEIFDYNHLSEFLGKDKVYPAGIINQQYRKRFDTESNFVVDSDVIYVDDNAYPYKIYKKDFLYFRYDFDFENFGACDVCLYIYFKNGTSVKICVADYSE